MTKKKTTGVYRNTPQPDKLPNKKHVIINDMRWKYKPDGFAEWLMEMTFPDWLPERLRIQAKDALRGLSEDMALEVADNVIDCWSYGVLHYIRVEHVDKMLKSLYNKILYCAEQQEVKLPKHF